MPRGERGLPEQAVPRSNHAAPVPCRAWLHCQGRRHRRPLSNVQSLTATPGRNSKPFDRDYMRLTCGRLQRRCPAYDAVSADADSIAALDKRIRLSAAAVPHRYGSPPFDSVIRLKPLCC